MKKIVVLLLCVLVLAGCATVPYTGPLYSEDTYGGGSNTNQSPSKHDVKEGIASYNNVPVAKPYVPVVRQGDGVVDPNRAVDKRKVGIIGSIVSAYFGGHI